MVHKAIDCHLHVQSMAEAETLLRAMDQARIESAVLMGSSLFTITLRTEDGFTRYNENNLELLKIRQTHPDRFSIWPTLDPLADGNCDRLRSYVEAGASGLKLYVGHGFSFGTPPRYMFHTAPINSEPLMAVYRYCEQNALPVCLHINTSDKVPGFREEFEQVLVECPKLRVLAPHWMLAVLRTSYLRSVFVRFPHLYTDISFGQDSILKEGLGNIARNIAHVKRTVLEFPDRILFGTDLVCTNAPFKTEDWLVTRIRTYRALLEADEFECPISHERRTGLHLPESALNQVLRENTLRLLQR